MAEFFSFLKIFTMCGTVFFITTLVLLAQPQSMLRSVGLEMTKWAMACGLLLLVPSPVDVIPDVIPGLGWLDDIGYIIAAIGTAGSALGEREKWAYLEELELQQVKSNARKVQRPKKDDHEESA